MSEPKIRKLSDASIERLQMCTNSILNFANQNLMYIKNAKDAEHVYDTVISMFQSSILLEKKTFLNLLLKENKGGKEPEGKEGKEGKKEKHEKKGESKDCSICKEKCQDPQFLPCFHFYCFSCIDTWGKYNKTCPICRNPF